MNLCVACGLDFGSVKAFDRHRVGTHEYTYSEGAKLGRDDGRRCLSEDEIESLRDKDSGAYIFARTFLGRWTIALSLEAARAQRL